ncbi:tigger transposable element-derived protein 2-like isoform X2 [Sparus aurata]|uniref:tigger transposable element-derived protein 2-like isoform X2 n=1 Tax=Sparus aurata TaxID=8175 RepID=UPI0011C1AB16|nr:tigger transposable element-derived protein 2-like isoform X2 [Sparus aurata]
MPRVYKRKTSRGATTDVLERATSEVGEGKSIRAAAKDAKIDRMTLKRCRELAYEFAKRNNIPVPDSWSREERAGVDWLELFKNRQHLSCRTPEATSLARATAFNEHNVTLFFDKLASVINRYKFPPNMIYNMDETGVTTVQEPKQIVTQMGKKVVGSVTSGERGELVTVMCAVNATGNTIPPMFIFPRVKYHEHFFRGAPTGSIVTATKSGWINEEVFRVYLEHVIQLTNCSKDHPLLLILDNHLAHVSLKSVEIARENGIVMLTLPPHTSHKMQPLNASVYGPLKTYYKKAMDSWMRTHPGQTASIYAIQEIVHETFLSAMTPRNILSGFRSTGIFLFNRDIFPQEAYAPSMVTDRPNPDEQSDQPSTSADLPAPSVTGPESSSRSDSAVSPSHPGYVSPVEIMPFPKVMATKPKRKHTKVKTQILTDTHEKLLLETSHRDKEKKMAGELLKKQGAKKQKNNSPSWKAAQRVTP